LHIGLQLHSEATGVVIRNIFILTPALKISQSIFIADIDASGTPPFAAFDQ
jgi:hypothetical protein